MFSFLIINVKICYTSFRRKGEKWNDIQGKYFGFGCTYTCTKKKKLRKIVTELHTTRKLTSRSISKSLTRSIGNYLIEAFLWKTTLIRSVLIYWSQKGTHFGTTSWDLKRFTFGMWKLFSVHPSGTYWPLCWIQNILTRGVLCIVGECKN